MNLTQAAETTVQKEKQAVEMARGGVPDVLVYIKSYYKIRTFVGVAGWTLPFILVIGGWVAQRNWTTQGSLSAYYYTGMRDFFVSILAVVGVLLITYRLSDSTPDNGLGTLAGAMAIGVVFFPTARDSDKHTKVDLTAVQSVFGERPIQVIHFICAIAFILLLARICLFFAELERANEQDDSTSNEQKMSSRKWYKLHRLAARIIFAAIAFALTLQALQAVEKHILKIDPDYVVLGFLKDYSILLGEAVAVFAFGMSWFIKGLDREGLRTKSVNTRELRANRDGELLAEAAH